MADLLKQNEFDLTSAEKTMSDEFSEQIINSQNYNPENFYHLLLTIACKKQIVLVFHQIDQADTDFFNSLLILAELLTKSEWNSANLKIIGLFTDDHIDNFNNFIDDLSVLHKPELIACLPQHIREWRKKIRENNENNVGQELWLTTAHLMDFARNDINCLDYMIAFQKSVNSNLTGLKLRRSFLEFSFNKLALNEYEEIILGLIYLFKNTQYDLFVWLKQFYKFDATMHLKRLHNKGVVFLETWSGNYCINGIFYSLIVHDQILNTNQFAKILLDLHLEKYNTDNLNDLINLIKLEYYLFKSDNQASKTIKTYFSIKLQKMLSCWYLNSNEMNYIILLTNMNMNFSSEEKLILQNRLLDLYLINGLIKNAELQAEVLIKTAIFEKSDYWMNTGVIKKIEILIKSRKFNDAQELIKTLRPKLQKNRETILLVKNELLKAYYCIELYDFRMAEEVLVKILKITENITNIEFIIEAMVSIAYIKYRIKEFDIALSLCGQCFYLIEKYNCRRLFTPVYALKSIIYLYGKDSRNAMTSVSKQLYYSRMYNQQSEQASAIKVLANQYRQTGFIKSAEKFFLKHLYYTSIFQNNYLTSISLFNLAEISLDQGKYESAMEYLKIHENIVINLNHARAIIDNYAVMAKIYKATGKFEDADLLYDKIISISEKNNIVPQTTPTEKAELYLMIGKRQEARHWLNIAHNNYFQNQQNKPDLLLKINILTIKLDETISIAQAEAKYYELFDSNHTEIQKALLYFELYMLTKNQTYHKIALRLYSMLYQEMAYEELNLKIRELKKS